MNARSRVLLSSLLLVIAYLGYNAAGGKGNSCVNVYIDFGPLTGEPTKIMECIDEVGQASALDVLRKGGVKIDGTQKYGDKVVCRVDNLPGPVIESCESMPPEKSYWAVLIKRKQLIPNPFDVNGKWNWAQTGISDVRLNPGDSLGLVFADNGKVVFP